MEYQVPQFIEIESKVIGPLTLKQFIYLAGAIGIAVACFFYLPIIVALLISAPVVGLGVALAFYKVNGKPFIEILEAGFRYYVGSKLFLWKHHAASETPSTAPAGERAAMTSRAGATARLTKGKLTELAWSLDVKQHEKRAEDERDNA